MSGARDGRRGTARLLAACAVLLGLFLMHGSPANAASGCHGEMLPPAVGAGEMGAAADGAVGGGEMRGAAAGGEMPGGGPGSTRALSSGTRTAAPRAGLRAAADAAAPRGGTQPGGARGSGSGSAARTRGAGSSGVAASDAVARSVVAVPGHDATRAPADRGPDTSAVPAAGRAQRPAVRVAGHAGMRGDWCVATPAQQRQAPAAPGPVALVTGGVLAFWAVVRPRAAGRARWRGPPNAGRGLLLQVGVART